MSLMADVGVFWVHNGRILGKARPLEEAQENVPGILDSLDSHADVWEGDGSFLASYPELHGMEYQNVPRGRVLYSRIQERPVVYMDRTLFTAESKRRIATYFGFYASQAMWRTDPHYTTDPSDLGCLFGGDAD